jgi:hypothetical protein
MATITVRMPSRMKLGVVSFLHFTAYAAYLGTYIHRQPASPPTLFILTIA